MQLERNPGCLIVLEGKIMIDLSKIGLKLTKAEKM